MWVAFAAAISILLSLFVTRAEAQCRDEACLRTATKLAGVSTQQSALLDATLNGLLGTSSVDLSVADHTALANADINLSGLAAALNQLGIGTDASSALNTPVPLGVVLQAVGVAARAQGSTSAADAVDKLRGQTTSISTSGIKLGDMITADTRSGPLSNSPINVLDLVTGSAGLFNAKNVASLNQVTVDGSSLGSGIGAVQLSLVVVQPATYVCGPQGSQFYSASMRLRARVNLTGASGVNLNVVGLTAVTLKLVSLDLVVALGRASGTLTAINAMASTLTVSATPGLAELYLGQVSDADFMDRTTPLEPTRELSSAKIATLDLNLLGLVVKADVVARAYALGTTPSASTLNFTGPYPQTLTATTQTSFLGNLVNTLLSNLTIQIDLTGSLGLVGSALTTVLNALLSTVTGVLSGTGGLLAPILNAVTGNLLDPVLTSLGVKIGEVSVTAERPMKITTGTSCNDGVYCTTNDTCGATGVCSGTPLSCDDGVSCTVDSCDEANLRCNNLVQNACRISGTCYASGATDPSNSCRACTPASSTSAWTTKANGASCDDGLYCTEVDTCTLGLCTGTTRLCADNLPCTVDVCDETNDRCTNVVSLGCLVSGVCVGTGADQPGNSCLACIPGASLLGYSPKPPGTACDDSLWCTVGDSCNGLGLCGGSARSCADPHACTLDVCNELTDQCVSTVAGGCLIGGQCIAAGADDPSNACRGCNPLVSTTSWTNKVAGTLCDDGLYCTAVDACNGSGACTGTPRVCAPGGGCSSVCDEGQRQCRTSVSGCTIGGACIAPGNVDPTNPCRACIPAQSTLTYSNLPNGTACTDSLYCTVNESCQLGLCVGAAKDCSDALSCTLDVCDEVNGRCSNTTLGTSCLIGGACIPAGTADPSNPCNACIPAVSTSAYSPRPAGFPCDDGQWCTLGDACNGVGLCRGGARTCDPIGLGCSAVCDEANDSCTVGISGCLINGACIPPGSDDPSNPCRACQPSLSTLAYTNKASGSSCNDGLYCTTGDVCNGSGACAGAARACDPTGLGCTARCAEAQGACVTNTAGCLIGGSCIPPGADDPSNGCRSCQPAISTVAYANKTSGSACSDGLFCTSGDACNGSGACVASPRDCSDNLGCTADSCDESLARCKNNPTSGCLINGSCIPAGSDDPTNPCRSCNPSLSTTAYSNKSAGAVCADGLFCTVGDACDGLGRCASTPRDCDDGLACTRDTCDEVGDRCNAAVDDGCLIGGTCRATGSDDPSNPCRSCNPSLSTSGWTNKPRGATCSDNLYCTVSDACNDTGHCIGTARSCGVGCSSVCDEATRACRASSDGCSIGGTCVAPGSLDPANPCRACNPSVSNGAYTNLAMGSSCDDGKWCTVTDACDGQGACAGRARDCSDDVSCTADSCDEAAGSCRQVISGGGCAIDGSCIAAGGADPLNPCRSCDPQSSTTRWTSRPAGYACDDRQFCTTGDACDGEGACTGSARDCNEGMGGCARACDESNDVCRNDVDGCTINGVCLAAGSLDPSNPCRACDPARSRVAFSDRAAGSACDDGAFCSENDRCDTQGRCVGAPRDCGDGAGSCDSSCDEALDDCVEGRPGCTIGGACVALGAQNPDNPCQVCDPARAPSAWSLKSPGSACDDGLFCTQGDACDASGTCRGRTRDCDDQKTCTRDSCDEQADRCSSEVTRGCLLQGSCVAAGAPDPRSPCRSCNPSVSITEWTNLPAAARCDDGQYCTVDDGCNGEGVCAGKLRNCGDGAGCSAFCDEARDACRSDVPGCEIGGTCVAVGTVDPQNACRDCNPALSTTGWSLRAVGSACDDGRACTMGDTCGADGRCAGGLADCSDAQTCTVDACDEAGGGCTHSSSNSCIIDAACVPAGASAPGNACLICDPARSSVAWSPAPANLACDDGRFCTPVDRCDASGRCVGGGVRCPSDGLDCTAQSCDEASNTCMTNVLVGCAIGNQCWTTGAASTSDPCLVCRPSRSTTSFTPDPLHAGCDSDRDGLLDGHEQDPNGGSLDHDGDGSPDHLDADDDGDGLPTREERADPDGDGGPQDARDLDGDGEPDYLDADDDGDTRDTPTEQRDVDRYDTTDDVDRDGTKNWHDFDSDGDGASDAAENATPGGDSNDDDIADYVQPDVTPADDDGDGIPDVVECPSGIASCTDLDGDGLADYRDPDDDDDGVLTRYELSPARTPTRNTDAPTVGGPASGQLQDVVDDHLDADDDGDGVPTAQENADPNGDGDPADARDSDADAIPDYLDFDDDGDGTPTRLEQGDANGNGIPDFLEPETTVAPEVDAGTVAPAPVDAAVPGESNRWKGGGLAGGGGGGCSASGREDPGSLPWLLLLLVLRTLGARAAPRCTRPHR